MVNFSIRPNKVEVLIQLIVDDGETWDVIKTIYFQNTFPFTYDVWKLANINSNFLDVGHNDNDFKSNIIVVMEFEILLYKFKASKKVDVIKTYLFWLLGVSFLDDLVQSIMSISNKCQCTVNK